MLPRFKYHPDPVSTGAIRASEEMCPCCGQKRGYEYFTTPYGETEVEHLCPWCIFDGSASAKFAVSFVDSWPLSQAGLPESVIDEVCNRTPAFETWQQECWLSCCGDACEFHGDAPARELRSLDESALATLSEDSGFAVDDLSEILRYYQPKGSPAFYKFVCRHCGKVRYGGDCD